MRIHSLFRKLMFFMVMLGITSFCIAEQNYGLLLVLIILGAFSWLLTETPHGRPLPRPLIYLTSVIIIIWLVLDLYYFRSHTLIAMGHFTIWLQLILLFSQKTNREYAQLIILSILQMIGASILSISMLYGILLFLYSTIAIITLLVFNLKLTNDFIYKSRQKSALDPTLINRPIAASTLDLRKYLRKTTLTVGLICFSIAILTFTITPRKPFTATAPSNFLNFKQRITTGFNASINLNNPAPQPGDNQTILNMTVERNGQNIGSPYRHFLLRGSVLDTYNRGSRQWSRSTHAQQLETSISLSDNDLPLAQPIQLSAINTATITYRQPSKNYIFTLPFAYNISSNDFSRILSGNADQQIRLHRTPSSNINYTIKWDSTLTDNTLDFIQNQQANTIKLGQHKITNKYNQSLYHSKFYARNWYIAPRATSKLAQSILEPKNLSRSRFELSTPDDMQIAIVLRDYLQSNFKYSLEAPPRDSHSKRDPVINFLFETHKGHCELFASGFAALCRSIGLAARVVTGFRASEFNALGGYYIVRNNDAHAWVEVKIDNRWVTFDATPPADVQEQHAVQPTFTSNASHFFEYANYLWIGAVAAFDRKTQTKLLDSIKQHFAAGDENRPDGVFYHYYAQARDWLAAIKMQHVFILLLLAVTAAVLTAFYLFTRYRIRRKATQLNLTTLPPAQRKSLARQLDFFLSTQRLLAQRGYHRPDWQSPMQFALQLNHSQQEDLQSLIELTRHFYDIRYGNHTLTNERKNLIDNYLQTLKNALHTPSASAH
ncbi:Protein-glutamine gamma-glutamyltransferase [Poriferisphaera corsica]|uniref:Protein-glutamine gamma-glutamyltransferase n=1 Tax=Poriferisphaera corsica TaxID=2528020 RepID=A0A517YWD1_9BACT|nr:DUF3488 and transglutaminase-like domain-containing protein [Poriferisphaera corsica]QDU34517.1 Protein-glutamine gamma-glutamyltransferase [Poriferisphaera corsica]